MRRPWFAKNRKGQALMEYVLLIALVATCLVAILGLTRKAANDAYAKTSVKLGPMRDAGFGSSGACSHPKMPMCCPGSRYQLSLRTSGSVRNTGSSITVTTVR